MRVIPFDAVIAIIRSPICIWYTSEQMSRKPHESLLRATAWLERTPM